MASNSSQNQNNISDRYNDRFLLNTTMNSSRCVNENTSGGNTSGIGINGDYHMNLNGKFQS